MVGGSEAHAGGNERRQGQPRRHETHCGRLFEEHDGAARSVQQRRAGSRFRYRRRRQAVPYLRPAQDAFFHVIFFAALWTTPVGAGALATIGTIALGTDTESDRISVRTPTTPRLQSAPPIAGNRPHARPHRTDPSSAPASPRPAAPPTCRPDCPGRPAWTRLLLCRTALLLHATIRLHGLTWSTFQYTTEIAKN